MDIVILDGYTLNPGDLSWTSLNNLGNVTIYERTSAENIVERSKHAEIILTNKTPLSATTLSMLPRLQYVGVLATGYNIVDTKAASALGITVTNVPGYGTSSVSQFVFALLLELCHHVQSHSDAVFEGDWSRSQDFCFTKFPLVELRGKTMGIIGMGSIGQQVAHIASAFGMKVIAATRSPKHLPGLLDVQWTSIVETLEHADVVSLHCPLTVETERMINREALNRMKKSAFLINTSRGGLVVNEDLAEALNKGTIAGAGLDVLPQEPPDVNDDIFTAKNCIITPHISWATKEARSRLLDIVVNNLRSYMEGQFVNAVCSAS